MFCKNCGAEVAFGSKFCPNCGSVLTTETTDATGAAASNRPPASEVFGMGAGANRPPVSEIFGTGAPQQQQPYQQPYQQQSYQQQSYQQQSYQQQAYQQQANNQAPEDDVPATGLLVLGILSIVFSVLNYMGVYFVHMVGIVLGCIAIAKASKRNNAKYAKAAVVLGVIGLCLGGLAFIIGFASAYVYY